MKFREVPLPVDLPAHGGDLADARAANPHFRGRWLDLSTGISPYAYPFSPPSPEIWTRLPDRASMGALEAAAAQAYGVREGLSVIAAPGTQAIIQILPRLRPCGRVVVVEPTYAEHARAWRLAGHEVRAIADPADGRAAPDCDVVVLANPNNPDGRRWHADELASLGAALAARGGWLVVDEAFADCEPGASLVPRMPLPGVIVLRSFGKFFGLAGVRLGFCLALPDVAPALRAALGPWAVGGAAAWIGAQALADRHWIAAMRERLRTEAAQLDRLLSDAGLQVAGGTALFRLVADDSAPALYAHFLDAGIFVRRFDAHPRWLRLGLPDAGTGLGRLAAALAAWRANPAPVSAGQRG